MSIIFLSIKITARFDISPNNAPLILCNTNKNLLLEKKKKETEESIHDEPTFSFATELE